MFVENEQADDQIIEGDKTPEENEEKGGEEEKPKSSYAIQKAKYREKLTAKEQELATLKGELEKLKGGSQEKAEGGKEKEAKEYIKKLILETSQEIEAQKKAEETRITKEFEGELDEILEESDTYTEEQILDVCSKFKVTPRAAVSILKEYGTQKKPKPSAPTGTRSTVSKKAEFVDTKGKSMYQLAREAVAKYKEQGGE